MGLMEFALIILAFFCVALWRDWCHNNLQDFPALRDALLLYTNNEVNAWVSQAVQERDEPPPAEDADGPAADPPPDFSPGAEGFPAAAADQAAPATPERPSPEPAGRFVELHADEVPAAEVANSSGPATHAASPADGAFEAQLSPHTASFLARADAAAPDVADAPPEGPDVVDCAPRADRGPAPVAADSPKSAVQGCKVKVGEFQHVMHILKQKAQEEKERSPPPPVNLRQSPPPPPRPLRCSAGSRVCGCGGGNGMCGMGRFVWTSREGAWHDVVGLPQECVTLRPPFHPSRPWSSTDTGKRGVWRGERDGGVAEYRRSFTRFPESLCWTMLGSNGGCRRS